jgi:hypothetical protein
MNLADEQLTVAADRELLHLDEERSGARRLLCAGAASARFLAGTSLPGCRAH